MDEVRASWKVSIRRACSALKVERSLYTYKSRRGDQADLKTRIEEITQTRVRYGYRRVHVLLRREGWAVNPKRPHSAIGHKAPIELMNRSEGSPPA